MKFPFYYSFLLTEKKVTTWTEGINHVDPAGAMCRSTTNDPYHDCLEITILTQIYASTQPGLPL